MTYDADSEHNQTTACATSSGCPTRDIGTSWLNASVFPPVARSSIGVRIGPGRTQFDRMPCCAYSTAADFVSEQTAALAAEYTEKPETAPAARTDALFTIAAAGDHDACTVLSKQLRRCETNSSTAASHDRHFARGIHSLPLFYFAIRRTIHQVLWSQVSLR